jgi:hypothetical protein
MWKEKKRGVNGENKILGQKGRRIEIEMNRGG